jgi:hypothetical protein
MITLLFLDGAMFFAVCLPSLVSALHNVPDGYEDGHGFHYGTRGFVGPNKG